MQTQRTEASCRIYISQLQVNNCKSYTSGQTDGRTDRQTHDDSIYCDISNVGLGLYLVILGGIVEVNRVTSSGRLEPVPRITHGINTRLQQQSCI